MIVLDTNVLSGIVTAEPVPQIVKWLDRQPPDEVYTTAITYYESWAGIARLGPSRRRSTLEIAFALAFDTLLAGRVLNFDVRAADAAAALAARRRRAGRPVETRDALIAGIVLAHKATLATGNTRYFSDVDISLINPLEA